MIKSPVNRSKLVVVGFGKCRPGAAMFVGSGAFWETEFVGGVDLTTAQAILFSSNCCDSLIQVWFTLKQVILFWPH